MKTCSKCGEEKALSCFGEVKTNRDGLNGRCGDCVSAYKREWAVKNHARLLEKQRKWRESNAEDVSAYHREYRKNNKKAIQASKAAYRLTDKAKKLKLKLESYYRDHERTKMLARESNFRNRESISATRKTPEYRAKARAQRDTWKLKNPELYKERRRLGRIKHAEHIKEYKRKHDLKHTRKRQCAKQERLPSWSQKELISVVYEKRIELQELWGVSLHVDHMYPLQGRTSSGLHVWENLQVVDAMSNQTKLNKHPREMVASGWRYSNNT